MGLATAAILLCLLSAGLPALEAGEVRDGLVSLGLSASSAAAAVAAWHLHTREDRPARQPALKLLEGASGVLRDALSNIRGFAELLARGDGRTDIRDACRFIIEGSEDVTGFIASLQDYVRCEEGRMILAEQQVDAAELVEAALSHCRRTAERADVVIIANLPEGVELNCDPARLRGAIANLVLWGARAAPKGSVVAVRLNRLPGEALAITVSGHLNIAAVDRPFEPDLERLGLTGLALPIARRVALLHSGDVTLEQGAGSGASLRLSLPAGRVTWPAIPENRAA